MCQAPGQPQLPPQGTDSQVGDSVRKVSEQTRIQCVTGHLRLVWEGTGTQAHFLEEAIFKQSPKG